MSVKPDKKKLYEWTLEELKRKNKEWLEQRQAYFQSRKDEFNFYDKQKPGISDFTIREKYKLAFKDCVCFEDGIMAL